jgi:hypothetical protein
LSKPTFDNRSFFLLWVINPFFSTLLLFKKMKAVKSITPILLFSFFFGISFVIAPGSNSDSHRYSNELYFLNKNPVDFTKYISSVYSEDGSKIDVYQPLLTWFVSKFTDDYKWLFAVFAMVFGFFWFQSIAIIRDKLPDKLGGIILIVFILFVFINPIWNINGVRMWTAVNVFFYGLLLLQIKHNKWGLVFIFLSSFIHFSLIIAVVLFLAYAVIPLKKSYIFFSLYLLTFFIGELNLDALKDYFELLPGFAQSRKGYLNESLLEGEKLEILQSSLHIRMYHDFLKYLILVITFWIFYKVTRRVQSLDLKLLNWYNQALFFGAFSNLAACVASGARFEIITNLLMLSSFLWLLSHKKESYMPTWMNTPLFIMSLFIVVVQIRMGLDYIGLFYFIGNPLVNMIFIDKIPFVDFIKTIF